MREWDGYAEKADVLVSELLGSFGDNELSRVFGRRAEVPEARRGEHPERVHELLGPDDVREALERRQGARRLGAHGDAVRREAPSVRVLAPPERVFTFVHPNRDPVIDNSRYAVCRFEPYSADSTMHGFAGTSTRRCTTVRRGR